MKTILGTIVLAGAVVGLYFLNRATKTEEGESLLHVAEALPVTVETTQPEERDIIRIVQAPGEVEPLSEVEISAEVVAKILEMPVEEGDLVQKGDLLCRLDDADLQARVASAEASVAKLEAMVVQADADFEKAERDLKRQVRLSEADATSELELADYHTAFVRAKASVEVRRQELIEAQAMLQSAREDLEKTVITAPIDGIISQKFAKEGEVVVMGTMNNAGTRIMVVSDLSKMQVRCRVDESDAPLVQNEQTARIYLQSDNQKSVPGHVLRVATKGTKPVGRDVVTFETLILVDSDDARVKPGMTANVEIEVARSDKALTIPVQAVVHRKRRDLPEELIEQAEKVRPTDTESARRAAEYYKIVFCIEDEVAHPRYVVTGISDEKSVEIISGVAPGAQIVVGPYRSLDQLKDGSKIKLPEEEKKADDTAEEESEPKTAEQPKPEESEKVAGTRS